MIWGEAYSFIEWGAELISCCNNSFTKSFNRFANDSAPRAPKQDNGGAMSGSHDSISLKPKGFGGSLRSYFLYGLVAVGPLTVTLWLVWWFIDTVDHWVEPLIPTAYLPERFLSFRIPGFGVLLIAISLTLLGFLARNLLGRSLISLSEMFVGVVPGVRGIYNSAKQIFETAFSQTGTSFRKVGLVEFPTEGMWSIVFISTPPAGMVARALPGAVAFVSVFLPCTPNPTTGFFFYVPEDKVVEIAMTPDAAAKLIMSAGLIQPDAQAELAALAADARAAREAELQQEAA
jgi:uncharacterized membrane protein